jgi:hypothetical protein
VNHSCAANALSCGWEFDVAIRDIAAGEEITNDYGCLNLERSFGCECREPGCRRRIGPEDFERLADHWDGLVRDAFGLVKRVAQPLWRFVPQPRTVSAAARNPARVPSIRLHHLAEPASAAQGRSARRTA